MNNQLINDYKLILASASPRRIELLASLGLKFTVQASTISEKLDSTLGPAENAQALALKKALNVAHHLPDSRVPHYILGADTIVTLDDKIFGKPNSPLQATEFLHALSGQTHWVITGFALLKAPNSVLVVDQGLTEVTFNKLSDTIIQDYVSSGDPMDKAGAYGLQNLNQAFIQSIKGSKNNVVGLPTEKILECFKRFGLVA